MKLRILTGILFWVLVLNGMAIASGSIDWQGPGEYYVTSTGNDLGQMKYFAIQPDSSNLNGHAWSPILDTSGGGQGGQGGSVGDITNKNKNINVNKPTFNNANIQGQKQGQKQQQQQQQDQVQGQFQGQEMNNRQEIKPVQEVTFKSPTPLLSPPSQGVPELNFGTGRMKDVTAIIPNFAIYGIKKYTGEMIVDILNVNANIKFKNYYKAILNGARDLAETKGFNSDTVKIQVICAEAQKTWTTGGNLGGAGSILSPTGLAGGSGAGSIIPQFGGTKADDLYTIIFLKVATEAKISMDSQYKKDGWKKGEEKKFITTESAKAKKTIFGKEVTD